MEKATALKGFRKNGNFRKSLSKKRAAKMLNDSSIFEEMGAGLKDEDQILNAAEKKATVQNLPPRFRMDGDARLGNLRIQPSLKVDEAERHERFRENARKIIRFLKFSASSYMEIPREDKQGEWQPMVKGLLVLLHNASEDFLLDSLLSGIDDSVRSVLGKAGFTIEDLLSLPRWSVTQNLEKGVYLDVLGFLHGPNFIRQLYVGAAAGQFGLAQRWYQYLKRQCGSETGRHSVEVMKPGSHVQLRGLAHYGHTPYPWLTCLAESFFMLYLGTISDPGSRYDDDDHRSTLIHDDLYKLVNECRSFAGLDARLAVGLNSTWSLSQGYRWLGDDKTRCQNCNRPWLPKSDAFWEPDMFRSRDARRPGEHVECSNCINYRSWKGVDRSPRTEKMLQFRRRVPVPDICEHSKCDRQLMQLEENEAFIEACKAKGVKVTSQCPDTLKWIPYVFQHDDILDGECHWVCVHCCSTKMGAVYRLYQKPIYYAKKGYFPVQRNPGKGKRKEV
jgi:hypothetical protein